MSNLGDTFYCGRMKCDSCNSDGTCMYNLTDSLIESVYSGEKVCHRLSNWVVSLGLKDTEVVVKDTDSSLKCETHKHSSYGMLCFNRINGGSPYLYGSSIKHNDKIQLVLKRGHYDRHLNQNWYHGGEELFELEMSYTQFVELITHMNMGDGVPVTLKRVQGQIMPECPYHNPLDVHKKEFEEHLDDVYSESKNLLSKLQDKFKEKKSFNKKEQEEILSILNKISMNIGCNQSFQLSQFNEQMEKTVTESKGEIEAFVNNKMYQIAQQAMVDNPQAILGSPIEVPQIESPKQKKKDTSCFGTCDPSYPGCVTDCHRYGDCFIQSRENGYIP